MLHPVIMCGGAGTRLWPASRPERPKPFIPLVGGRSTFALTLERIAALDGASRPIIVAGPMHTGLIQAELDAAGLLGLIVIEPEPRDSAPAMAAAALVVREADPEGVCLFLAADHHIPDTAAFAAAVSEAVAAAAGGDIVTLGMTATEPATGYGYIRPGEALGTVRRVDAFVEKPDPARAERFVAEGFLWNSGMFIVRVDALLDEFGHAPGVVPAVERAVQAAVRDPGQIYLGEAFREATKISIDYAVMERTAKAVVLPTRFDWSDLGAWPTILAAAEPDAAGNALIGAAVAEDVRGSIVVAGPGMTVAVNGLSDIAVIAEGGEVIVTAMERADQVKGLVERAIAAGRAPVASIAHWRERMEVWFEAGALPLWCTLGAEAEGGFQELLGLNGRPVSAPHRMRVQARQAYVYARAGQAGWPGPWREAVRLGLSALNRLYRRPDGLYRTLVGSDGAILDDSARLYDQAFVLLALASAFEAGVDADAAFAQGKALLALVEQAFVADGSGLREDDSRPFQSNPHLHLFEASLAWAEASGDPSWQALASRLADLTMNRFIEPEGGFLREFFDSNWRPAEGADGRVVEPGHQFEWAWLLTRRGVASGDQRALAAADRLYACGVRGVDTTRNAVIDALDADLAPMRRSARLWPQTERVKAALMLAELQPANRDALLADASSAMAGLWRYFDGLPPGLYRDKQLPAGGFVDEPAPASSLYHLWTVLEALRSATAD